MVKVVSSGNIYILLKRRNRCKLWNTILWARNCNLGRVSGSWLICWVYGFQGINADFTSEKHQTAAGDPSTEAAERW